METSSNTSITTLPDEVLMSRIYLFRDQKVMLDRDLAELYGVTTGNLNKAVKRNIKRFPEDFMFQLDESEFKNLIFQNGTSSWGGTRKPPFAFTEQGVAMLSGILNSISTDWRENWRLPFRRIEKGLDMSLEEKYMRRILEKYDLVYDGSSLSVSNYRNTKQILEECANWYCEYCAWEN